METLKKESNGKATNKLCNKKKGVLIGSSVDSTSQRKESLTVMISHQKFPTLKYKENKGT